MGKSTAVCVLSITMLLLLMALSSLVLAGAKPQAWPTNEVGNTPFRPKETPTIDRWQRSSSNDPQQDFPVAGRPVVSCSIKNDVSLPLRSIEPISPTAEEKIREIPLMPLPHRVGSNEAETPGSDPAPDSRLDETNMPASGELPDN